jgi:hypothetical protein
MPRLWRQVVLWFLLPCFTVTDAPGVDVNLTGGATLVANAQYGDNSGYLSVPPTWYPISIAPAGSSTAVANYVADLSGLAGNPHWYLPQDFSPASNSNGPAFALYRGAC